MTPRAQPLIALSLAATLVLTGGCRGTSTALVEDPHAHAGSGAPGSTGGASTGASPARTDLKTPGVDTSALSAAAKKELATVLNDEFCYCGCPHTLGACLLEHGNCRHAKRMTRLAAALARDGVGGAEIINTLAKYYQSFRSARAGLKLDPRLCRGAKDAQVTVVEFADFECPFCAAARPTIERFAEKNAAKVRTCYATFPLQGHPNAIPAGQAALFARDHDRFWEMHDLLFEHQDDLGPASLRRLAQSIGLDGAALQQAIDAGKYVDELNAMKAQGKAAGVTGTPTLLVNGRRFELGLSADLLEHTVDDELEWISGNNAWVTD